MNSLDAERCALNRRIYNQKIKRQNMFFLKVMTVLVGKLQILQKKISFTEMSVISSITLTTRFEPYHAD